MNRREYIVNPCGGIAIDADRGDLITVTDLEGGQVVDFFAVIRGEADVRLGIAACSVSESACNSGRGTAVKIVVGET